MIPYRWGRLHSGIRHWRSRTEIILLFLFPQTPGTADCTGLYPEYSPRHPAPLTAQGYIPNIPQTPGTADCTGLYPEYRENNSTSAPSRPPRMASVAGNESCLRFKGRMNSKDDSCCIMAPQLVSRIWLNLNCPPYSFPGSYVNAISAKLWLLKILSIDMDSLFQSYVKRL